jgi:ACS family D-galactonate transporter-like MFS transporter
MPAALLMTQHESRSLRVFLPALVLLVISLLINYIDRGNISIAGPLVKKEFGLSATQLGRLFAAFFVTYTGMQFIIGWLVDRVNANYVLAAGFLMWSLATAATGMVRGFAILLVMRLILGIGESVALPCSTKIQAQNLPEHHRGLASGALMSALRCGNAVGTLFAGLLMARFGWRPVFIVVGLGSLIWLPAWVKWMPRGGPQSAEPAKGGPGVFDIIRRRAFWGTSSGHFSSNYLFYFMMTWLPSYLVLARHLSMQKMTGIAGLYYAVDAGSAIVGGWAQDFALRRGHSATVVRKTAMVSGFALAAVAVPACALAAGDSYLPWLMMAGVGCGLTSPGLLTLPSTLAGPGAVGKWYGTQNGFANLSGVIGPALTGWVVDHTGSFLAPFIITAGICVFGASGTLFVVGRVEPVLWKVVSAGTSKVAGAEA